MDDRLLTRAKKVAAETGKTLTSVIEGALRESFARRAEGKRRVAVRLKTFKGRGLQPGVDLDDTSSLFDLIDAKE